MPTTVDTLRTELIERVRPLELGARPWTVVDFPSHFNSGDSAIWLGEVALARALGTRIRSLVDRSTWTSARVSDDALLMLHGGGNLGGLYPTHEQLRLKALETHKDRTIVQLPQSIEFADEESRDRLRRAIGACRDFHLLVRDDRSLAIAQRDFDCETLLVPDAAFAIGTLRRAPSSAPLAVQRRVDREADASGEGLSTPTFDWLDAGPREPRRMALWLLKKQLRGTRFLPGAAGDAMRLANANWLAKLNLDRARELLSTGDRLVTDRLHGHVIASLLGIPHLVVNDRYGKIEALFTTWTGALGIGEFAPDWNVAMARARELSAGA